MTHPIDLSIVIVSFNTRALLAACLQSVFANLQGLSAEVFVIDNASNDGSGDMVRESFKDARLIENQVNRGFAAANNQGIRCARGRHILLLNPDTVVMGGVLGASVRYLQSNPAVGAMGCRVLNPDGSVQLTCFSFPSAVNSLLKATGLFKLPWPRFFSRERMDWWKRDNERDVDVVTGCYLMVPRRVIDRVGLLDEAFYIYYEETDWCRRINDAGYEVRFAPVGEIVHIGNAAGRSLSYRRSLLLCEGKIRLHLKHGTQTSARLVWALGWLFALVRAAVLNPVAWLSGQSAARDRAQYFNRILATYGKVWALACKGTPYHKLSHNGTTSENGGLS